VLSDRTFVIYRFLRLAASEYHASALLLNTFAGRAQQFITAVCCEQR